MVQMLEDKITYQKGYNQFRDIARANRGNPVPTVRSGGLPLDSGVKEYQFYSNPYSESTTARALQQTDIQSRSMEQYAAMSETPVSTEEVRNKTVMNAMSGIFNELFNEIETIDSEKATIKIGQEPTGESSTNVRQYKEKPTVTAKLPSSDSELIEDMLKETQQIPENVVSKSRKKVGSATPAFTVTEAERDRIIRTMIGEAEGESEIGQAAVAHIIFNRLNVNTRQFGKTIKQITRPEKFSAWLKTKEGNPRVNVPKSSEAYKKMSVVFDKVLSGEIEDPTNYATHYWSPSGVLAANKKKNPNSTVDTPYWADSEIKKHLDGGLKIGNHIFAGYTGKAGEVTTSSMPLSRPSSLNNSLVKRRTN